MEHLTPWIVLISFLLALLLIDFFILHKKNSETSIKRAVFQTVFFVTNALLFSGLIYWFYDTSLVANVNNLEPSQAVVKYLTGYLIELSLSVDNLFVIAIIFTSFKIPKQYQHQLLFLGILGAIVFRAILIGIGLILLEKIHGMSIIFGLFLLFTAFKMLKKESEHKDLQESKGVMKLFRFSKELDGGKYITRINGKRVFTALFGALLTIEFTDLLFALDSIPAIFAITTDPFIVYSSNIFAILGLRSLYFFLSNMLEKFVYLKYSVFSILIFVSLKLMTASLIEIPEWFSLLFIAVSLSVGIYVSTLKFKSE
ncbi:TerC/Alx family metal homeostasis membrane protein [Gelidibacter sp.]|uniref:TerC/Alx family metal homeostasis membrane protein n=1 Tax=Gelidibacter sp. TaxID=2018083 RepID=UPI002B772CD7|nr:TerC/Alx family metal homeostasis membrane protein [Gelidibacter sp.]HUH28725.1 TerC/Alx family metal homeostasis membrane protein [Gelidibacter sp.]